MKIGYLPLITKGGGVFGDVFDWETSLKIINESITLFKKNEIDVSYIDNPIYLPEHWKKSETKFIKDDIDVLFVHNLNIVGGENLYHLINKLKVPVIIASVPEPSGLYKPPYTKRFASFCGGQWNMNMCYLIDVKAKFLFGDPRDEDFEKELIRTLTAIKAVNELKEWKVCLIGDKTPGYYGAVYSEDRLMRKFEARVMYLDFGELSLLQKKIAEEEVKTYIDKSFGKENLDKDLKTDHLHNTVRIFLALKKFAKENDINSFTMKCVEETIKVLGVAPCGINSLLTNAGLISGCEGDVLATLTMQINYLLSGLKPLMIDIMSIREEDGSMLLWHCGAGAEAIAGNNKVTYRSSPILCTSGGDPQGVCVDFTPNFNTINMSQLTEDWKTGDYRFFSADGEAVSSEHFIGGNPVKAKFSLDGEKVGDFIIRNRLPHHFQLTGRHLTSYLKEFCYWKDIDLLQI